MYLPFCGISISNAKLFSESRKEYERSRVRKYQLCIYKTVLEEDNNRSFRLLPVKSAGNKIKR